MSILKKIEGIIDKLREELDKKDEKYRGRDGLSEEEIEKLDDEINDLNDKIKLLEDMMERFREYEGLADAIETYLPFVKDFVESHKEGIKTIAGMVVNLLVVATEAFDEDLAEFSKIRAKQIKREFDSLTGVGFTAEQALQIITSGIFKPDFIEYVKGFKGSYEFGNKRICIGFIPE